MKVSRFDSSDTNVCKYVFDFGDAVAVLYKYPTYEDRTVICCFTQSGCQMGCTFCGAGDHFVRSLTAAEIVGQIQHVLADKGIDPAKVAKGQIMFMSMGEPLMNFEALAAAVEELYGMYPNFDLLISTSAPVFAYSRLAGLAERIPTVGVQFSVHESTDEARNKLIPFPGKLSLAELAFVGDYWAERVGRQPFFNYCAHEGNTSEDDADRLLALFDPNIWQCTVSVICERDESIAAAHTRQEELVSAFMGKLLERGFSVRGFNPAGQDDIGGGCGQLWYVQEWMRGHSELAQVSVGRQLSTVGAMEVAEWSE